MLFTIYSDDCRTDTPNQYILNYSDDTVVVSLLSNSGTPELHQHGVNKVVKGSGNNTLEMNAKKTEEIISGSPSDSHRVPTVIYTGKSRRYFYINVMHITPIVCNVMLFVHYFEVKTVPPHRESAHCRPTP